MISIASCPICKSTSIMFVASYADGRHSCHFHCYTCENDTPERAEMRDADADVIWIPRGGPVPVKVKA